MASHPPSSPFDFIKGYATFSSMLCHFSSQNLILFTFPITLNIYIYIFFPSKVWCTLNIVKYIIFSIKGMVHTQHYRNEVKNFLILICTHGIILPQVLFCLFVFSHGINGTQVFCSVSQGGNSCIVNSFFSKGGTNLREKIKCFPFAKPFAKG